MSLLMLTLRFTLIGDFRFLKTEDISSRFFSNSEALASELLDNHAEMFSLYDMHIMLSYSITQYHVIS